MPNRYAGLTIVVLRGLLKGDFRNLKYQVDSYSVVTSGLSTNYLCSNSSLSHSCYLDCYVCFDLSVQNVVK